MIDPYAILNQNNFSGLLSLPQLPSIMTGTPPFVAQDNNCPTCPNITPVLDTGIDPKTGELQANQTPSQSLSSLSALLGIDFEKYFKNYMLLSLALILLVLGLYMLAVSTEVGRDTIATGAKAIAA